MIRIILFATGFIGGLKIAREMKRIKKEKYIKDWMGSQPNKNLFRLFGKLELSGWKGADTKTINQYMRAIENINKNRQEYMDYLNSLYMDNK